MKHKTYLVGGAVRDRLLGQKPKDLDFVMLAPSFEAMEAQLLSEGAEIFVRKPEFLVIRCKHPKLGCVDFACGRLDGDYNDGRHPESTVITTSIVDELSRRDFTVNAIAQDVETQELVDPFHGQVDLKEGILRCVGEARKRFDEDGLRIIRAIRFAVTKNFLIDSDIDGLLRDWTFFGPRLAKIPTERIRDEVFRCFAHDTNRTLDFLDRYNNLRFWIFNNTTPKLWLKPTTERP